EVGGGGVRLGDAADALGELVVVEGAEGGVRVADAVDPAEPGGEVRAPRLDPGVKLVQGEAGGLEGGDDRGRDREGGGGAVDAGESGEQAGETHVREEAAHQDPGPRAEHAAQLRGDGRGVVALVDHRRKPGEAGGGAG